MHYYPKHIRDYLEMTTAHLILLEHGAYYDC